MRVTIKPNKASGRVLAPSSKSMAHRMLICAAMSEGVSVLHRISDCEDVSATIDCLNALGIECEKNGDVVRIVGRDMRTLCGDGILKCRESGSTLRFLVPPAMLSSRTVVFSGEEQLMRRPMNVYKTLSEEKGFFFLQNSDSVIVKGPLKSGEYTIPGNISSQFISGLLFALPVLEGDSYIRITPPIESRSYINMTIYVQSLFGVDIQWKDDRTLFIKGGQRYIPAELAAEGDYSGAAFLDALNVIGSEVYVDGLKEESTQGDSIYKKHFKMFENGIPSIHLGDCPDLAPILFALSAAKNGGIFSETRRLKFKESDRAETMAQELRKFGASVGVHENNVVVYPTEFHAPTEVLSGHGDHRIVMALSVLLTLTGGSIDGAEAVNKSYPDFFKDLGELGIEVVYENN